MGLRKGSVVQTAVQQQPDDSPFDVDQAPQIQVAPPPSAPAPVQAQSTAMPEQQRSAEVRAAQAAPAGEAPIQGGQLQVAAGRQVETIPGAGKIKEVLAAEGFDGVDFGFGSFPIITLQDNSFFQTSEGGNLGSSFNCVLLGSRAKWFCKNDQKGPAQDFFYTFDRMLTVGGDECDMVIAGWKKKGWNHEWKKYLDVQAQMVTDDEDNGSLILISIPPTSISRFSGYVGTLVGRHGGKISDFVTRISIGEKITKVQYPFNPFAFEMLRRVS